MRKDFYFRWSIFLLISLGLLSCSSENPQESTTLQAHYLSNRAPLKPNPYLELPLGSIKPNGWLKEQLERMASGMTGNLDTVYPEVVGERNGWLGGDGDGWERGPYWIDGLLPLAFILDDDELREKAMKWVNWTLTHQAESGYIGPVPFEEDPTPEAGIQKGPRKDWWPKMVMLKILKQYYQATHDARVIEVLTKYFHYQLNELPSHPLDELSFWANRRAGDNLEVIYWLYNITGDQKLLDLGELVQEQTFPWQQVFESEPNDYVFADIWEYNQGKRYPYDATEISRLNLAQVPGLHTVNVAQGLKQPVVYYQKSGDPSAVNSVKNALAMLKKYHGQPQGMYGGDEPLHGNSPVQGIEFCSISEEMFSLETILKITGDASFADLLEKITYNALPTQASDDFTSRQYFQAANQVVLSDEMDYSYETEHHGGTDFVFGELTGYPCCTTNMHQSWPKFVQNLFYATPDAGVAALLYAPSSVELLVGNGERLQIKETTGFPFRESIQFELNLSATSDFPFHLRIPSWAVNPTILINGESVAFENKNGIAIIQRTWQDGDQVELNLPMQLKSSTWYEGMVAIERGPLVYSLKIEGETKTKDRNDRFRAFQEVYPLDPWNYGLKESTLNDLESSVKVQENPWDGSYPWNLENAPIQLTLPAYQIPSWKLINQASTDLNLENLGEGREVVLVPYGTTTLRITEFPLIKSE
ncbi:beta-L-arabinofuranosidase domain-containing protein [Algoriphagus halophilus]|uniref:Beta-L-arabinofuranosidase, GH127 n=1 Tax=Algoriphagus halophilus TaxID=226505 RepID=A0A1N6HU29_9BACT|nr:beta-L-arabinofuranosidase domain-containing protein [Algoriphagus halophilus]SIO23314.1 Beta-L-arabinofuranosidase, GH127 [Algoriphagus halophilus]